MEDRVKNLEKQIKRIGINNNNISINSNKIKTIEKNLNNLQNKSEPEIQPKQIIDNSRIDLLEKKFQQFLITIKKKDDIIKKKDDIINKLINDKNKNENEKNFDEILEEKINNKFKSQEKVFNSKFDKFKSEVLPPVNQLLAHREMKLKRKKRIK